MSQQNEIDNIISDRIREIKEKLPQGTDLVAVSKFHPIESILSAYREGQRIFGESRVQELVAKEQSLNYLKDIKWHFIGKLQRNKVKYIVGFIDLIHSVDSISLIDEIERCAEKISRPISILLELKVAKEETKTGFDRDELIKALSHIKDNRASYRNIKIRGLMSMATNTSDIGVVDNEFAITKALFDEIKNSDLLIDRDIFTEISMGMSGDYEQAVKYGSTMVRIGSRIFGNRIYNN